MTPQAIILDTETTGFKNPDPVEISYINITVDPSDFREVTSDNIKEYLPKGCKTELFLPNVPIEPGAFKVHGISMEKLKEANARNCREFQLPKVEYMIGHFIQYDWKVLKCPDIKLICTKKLAQIAFATRTDYTKFGLVPLILKLFPKEGLKLTSKAHRAEHDILLTALLLNQILKALPDKFNTWESLYKLCNSDGKLELPTIMPYGKHKGRLLVEIPLDYLQYMEENGYLNDPMLVKAVKKILTDEGIHVS